MFTDKAFDSILLYAKYFIYKCKLQETIPQLDLFLSELKHRIIVEKALALRAGKIYKFSDKWKTYARLIDANIV